MRCWNVRCVTSIINKKKTPLLMFTAWHLISLIFNAQKNCSIFMNESVKRFNIHIEFFLRVNWFLKPSWFWWMAPYTISLFYTHQIASNLKKWHTIIWHMKKNNVLIVLKKIITLFLYDHKPLWQNSRMNHKTSVSVYISLHYMSVVLLMKPFTWFIKCVCVFSRVPFLPCTHFFFFEWSMIKHGF